MDQGRASVSYAKALLDYSVEKHVVETVYAQTEVLLEILKKNPDFYLLLHSPMVSLSKKIQITNSFLKDFTPVLVNLIVLVIKNGREKLLENIILVFQKNFRERFNIIKTFVESAKPLELTTKNSIKDYLSKTYNKSVELVFLINPDIIGGFILTIEDRLLDKSVKRELEQLRKKLIGIE